MSDFWERQRDKLQKEGVIPAPRVPVTQSDGPWWASGTSLVPKTQQPQEPVQARAKHADGCPTCGSDNYTRPTPNSVMRCFECGHAQGRQLNEPNIPTGMISSGAKTIQVKQLASQGHFGRSVAEINENQRILLLSEQGKAQLG